MNCTSALPLAGFVAGWLVAFVAGAVAGWRARRHWERAAIGTAQLNAYQVGLHDGRDDVERRERARRALAPRKAVHP